MDIKKLINVLNNNKYLVLGDENLSYCFQNETLSITGYQPSMVHYLIYEEDNNFFLKTNPPLYTEDLRIDIVYSHV